ncbi:hypothetical protein HYX11_04495 [Candidatus Woesearchaeota archaeon]|nr:hypothetical protein [Candidatus Woesearchaeota archaeon]
MEFLLVSPTHERGLKLSLIKSPSGVGRTKNVVTKSFYIADALGTDVVFTFLIDITFLRSRLFLGGVPLM